MQRERDWAPSKVVYSARRKAFVANPERVSRGSRIAVDVLAPQYARLLQTHARGRLLDCGCGDVPYYGIYKDLVSEVTCIDWESSEHPCVHVDMRVDLNGDLPFGPAHFDTVLLADVLEHIEQPAHLLSELSRVLAPGGRVIVLVPFLYAVHEAPHDYYRYTRFALERLTLAASMQVEALEPLGGYPDVLLDTMNKGMAPLGALCEPFLAAAALLAKTPAYGRWRARTAERFPLAYGLVARRS